MIVYTPRRRRRGRRPADVAHRPRRVGGRRRVRRERRDEGGPRVPGDAPGRRRHHDRERERLPQRRRAAASRFEEGQRLVHGGVHVLDRERLPLALLQRRRADRALRAQHAVRDLLRAQLRRRLRPRAGRRTTRPPRSARSRTRAAASPSDPLRATRTRRHRQLPGELVAGVDADLRDAARYTAQLLHGFQSDPVPQRLPRRGPEGAGASAREPRAPGPRAARELLPAADQGRHSRRRARLPRHVGHHERHGEARDREVSRSRLPRSRARPLLQADAARSSGATITRAAIRRSARRGST